MLHLNDTKESNNIYYYVPISLSKGNRKSLQEGYRICEKLLLRESSFNMTRGREDEDTEGGLPNFLDTQKGAPEEIRGGSKNLYISKPSGGGGGGS